jgi:hypothetical protein
MDEYVFVVKGSGRIYLSDRSINPFRSFTSKWVTSSPLPKGYMCQFEASSDEDGLQFVAYADVEDAHLALAPIFLAMQPPPYQEYIDSTSNIEGTTFPSCTSGTTPCRPAGPFFAQTLQPIEPATDVLSSHRPARVRASFEPSRTESLFKICTETQAVNAKYTSHHSIRRRPHAQLKKPMDRVAVNLMVLAICTIPCNQSIRNPCLIMAYATVKLLNATMIGPTLSHHGVEALVGMSPRESPGSSS